MGSSTAGERIYFAGTRVVNGNANLFGAGGGSSYPFIDFKDQGRPWQVDYDPGCASKDAPGHAQAQAPALTRER